MYVRSRMHAEELFNSKRCEHRRRIDIVAKIGVPNGVDSGKGEQIKERITEPTLCSHKLVYSIEFYRVYDNDQGRQTERFMLMVKLSVRSSFSSMTSIHL